MPVPYKSVQLMHVLNAEIVPVTVTVPFNTVQIIIVKTQFYKLGVSCRNSVW